MRERLLVTGLLLAAISIASIIRVDNSRREARFYAPSTTSKFISKVSRNELVGEFIGTRTSRYTFDSDGRYENRYSDCGGGMHGNTGRWRLDGDVVVVEVDNEKLHRLVPIRWASVTYLLDEGRMDTGLFHLLMSASQGESTYLPMHKAADMAKTPSTNLLTKPILPDRYQKIWSEWEAEFHEDLAKRGRNLRPEAHKY